MKNLLAILIGVSLLLMGTGTVFANEPESGSWDRNAVWSDWFDKDGNRIHEGLKAMDVGHGTARTVSSQSIQSMDQRDMNKNTVKKFDFIHETKTYDYSKDHGSTS